MWGTSRGARQLNWTQRKVRTGRDEGGADEHSSCGDILSTGTEVQRHKGRAGESEQPRMTGVWRAEETGPQEQEPGLEAGCQPEVRRSGCDFQA